MKTIGVIRRFDELGRIVIPKEYRRQLDVASQDFVEITLTHQAVIIKKPASRCALCSSESHLLHFAETLICLNCVEEIKSLK